MRLVWRIKKTFSLILKMIKLASGQWLLERYITSGSDLRRQEIKLSPLFFCCYLHPPKSGVIRGLNGRIFLIY